MLAIEESIAVPTLHSGTQEEIRLLAKVRGLSTEGLLMAQERGLLRFGQHYGQPAWFVLDKTLRNIQTRRLDGQLWFGRIKALSLKNSNGNWPIGLYESLEYPNIAIVEGMPDLLAAHHFLWAEEYETRWGVITILGASSHFPPEAIPLLKDKSIKIFYHHDKAAQGMRAAYRWGLELGLPMKSKHFCCGPIPMLGGEIGKDLNDQAHITGDAFEELRAKNMHLLFS